MSAKHPKRADDKRRQYTAVGTGTQASHGGAAHARATANFHDRRNGKGKRVA